MVKLKNHSYKPTFDNIPKEKRDRILAVATSEFANNGFENTSIYTIAKKAKISVGSLYKYFDSKDNIFITVVQMGLYKLEGLLTEIYAKDEDVIIKVERIIRELIYFSRKNPDLIKLYAVVTASKSSPLLVSVAQEMEAISADIYIKAIVEGQKTGDVREGIDPAFFAFMLDNIFMSLQFSYACDYYKKRYAIYDGNGKFDSDEFVVEQTLKFIKAAFNFK
ncbi:MAG TPA: TetR/AcrR family transcriptional regulator [Oscillospiraceae bacterium]|nr:TetR/AcrR family transcriptional regulator [Oscillospiraceae bacterium]